MAEQREQQQRDTTKSLPEELKEAAAALMGADEGQRQAFMKMLGLPYTTTSPASFDHERTLPYNETAEEFERLSRDEMAFRHTVDIVVEERDLLST